MTFHDALVDMKRLEICAGSDSPRFVHNWLNDHSLKMDDGLRKQDFIGHITEQFPWSYTHAYYYFGDANYFI